MIHPKLDICDSVLVEIDDVLVPSEVIEVASSYVKVFPANMEYSVILVLHVDDVFYNEDVNSFECKTSFNFKNHAPASYFNNFGNVEVQTVFNLDTNEGVAALFAVLGFKEAVNALTAVQNLVAEYEGEGCQDSLRLSIISLGGHTFDDYSENVSAYDALVTCCGSEDRLISMDGNVYKIGLNYGH
jgi:hypothetical protein